jgi:hypothetical protein
VHFTPPDPYVRFNRCHTARATGRGGPVRPNPEWFPAANSTPAGSPAPGAGRSGEVASRFRHGGRCRFNDKVGFDSTKHGIKPVVAIRQRGKVALDSDRFRWRCSKLLQGSGAWPQFMPASL